MITGTLKFFSAAKGFGFITRDEDGKDVFLPAAAIAAGGVAKLQAGLRVAFEQEADVKGPKAVKLTLLEEKPKPATPPPSPRPSITIHCDPATPEATRVLRALADAGHQARLVDYSATPPDREELKRLSLILRSANQSLVRRYDALYLDLQLDDRFIPDNEFWTAIVEHPALINGPVLVQGTRAQIAKSAADVRSFLGLDGPESAEKKHKGISPRMAAMMLGQPVPPPAPKPEPAPKPALKLVSKTAPVESKLAKPEPKAAATVKPAPKKTVAPAKKVAKAPVKKAAAKKPAAKKPAAKKKKK